MEYELIFTTLIQKRGINNNEENGINNRTIIYEIPLSLNCIWQKLIKKISGLLIIVKIV